LRCRVSRLLNPCNIAISRLYVSSLSGTSAKPVEEGSTTPHTSSKVARHGSGIVMDTPLLNNLRTKLRRFFGVLYERDSLDEYNNEPNFI